MCLFFLVLFFFNDTATTEIYTLSLHDALPICRRTLPLLAEVVSRNGGEDQPALRRQRPGAEANEGIAGAGGAAQSDLPGGDDQAVVGLDVAGFALPLDETEHATLWQRLAGRPHREVNSLTDTAGRQTDLAPKIICLAIAQTGGHGFSLTEDQPVEGTTRREVQGVSDIEQSLVRPAYAYVRPISQPARRKRSQHRHIAEASARLLEVWLQQIGSVSEGSEALIGRGQQLRQPFPGVATPALQQRGTRTLDQLRVAGDHAQVEQAHPGTQLTAGDLGTLRRRAYRMINPDPRVPEWIPQVMSQRVDLGRGLAVMQQHEVDVRARPKLLAGQAADGGKGGSAGRAAHFRIELDERRLDALCDQTPTIRPRCGRPLGPDRDVETLAG